MPRESYYQPQRQLVNQQNNALIPRPNVPRSKFVNTWTRISAYNAGVLYPIMVDEIMPGDFVKYDVAAFLRMATPLFPIFNNQRVDIHFFFTPTRIVWHNWETYIGGGVGGARPTPLITPPAGPPYVDLDDGDITIGSLYDHFGLPTEGQLTPGQTIRVLTFPFRMYNQIWNDWYRDQNLQDYAVDNDDDGPDSPSDYILRRRGKFHDYFTSALPSPQHGPGTNIPVLGNAPVMGIGIQGPAADVAGQNWLETGGLRAFAHAQALDALPPVGPRLGIETDNAAEPQIFADLSQASGVTLADFRESVLLQELLERDARGGTRYIELILNHFDVRSLDARLMRPEYIGGGSAPLRMTPIAQTAPTATEPLGALGGAATAAGQIQASYAATEHGYVIALLSVRTELAYQQGLHRMWTRENRYDWPWPTLAGLSEQAILRQEIYCTGTDADDQAVWGYQERYQEYRTKLSEVTGVMRSAAPGSLDTWHLAQDFSPAPQLNDDFIEDNPPMDRILAAGSLENGQQYRGDIMFTRTAVRPLPTYGVPASLARF